METVNVVAAIIKHQNKILIAQRGYGEFKGMYEFPGGKIEKGETQSHALKRELKEEMNADIEDHFILEMDCYLCHLNNNHIDLLEHTDYMWISLDENNIPWVPADVEVFDELRKRGI